jgi:hypothetical protein
MHKIIRDCVMASRLYLWHQTSYFSQRSLYSGMAVSRIREHAPPEVVKSSRWARVNYCGRSFVNAATEDLYTGITKANMSDVQQASIGKFERPAKESSRPRSRQFASSLGVAPAVSALHTTRPHTAGGANNARTGHIIKEFFTFDKSRIEPSDHNKIAGKIWIMSELERGQGEFRMTPFFHRDSPSWPMRGVK